MSRFLNPRESLALHRKGLELLPRDEFLKPTTYMVGIVAPDNSLDTIESESDLLWIKCHKKIILAKIRDAYLQRFPGEEVTFLTATQTLDNLSMPLGELNDYGDNVLIFRAVKTTSLRQPLVPTSNQSIVKPGSPEQGKMFNSIKKMSPLSPHHALKALTSLGSSSAGSASPAPSGTQHVYSRLPQPSVSESAVTNNSATLPPVKRENREETSSWNMPETLDKDRSSSPFELQDDTESSKSEHIKDGGATASGNFHLKDLFTGSSPEMLERVVETGLAQLEELSSCLAGNTPPTPDSLQWLKQIEAIKSQAVKTRTVVGVVGNTGAGKSSVINAMLDEERLVPTNCMRACTAVVTEISYNESEDPERKYSAQIEFIATKDWEKELKILFKELIDADGRISRDCGNLESEAGIAYAKIRAVYPKKSKDDLAKSSVESLMREPAVKDLFGTMKEIHCRGSQKFYTTLQHFVDSKEKSTTQGKSDKNPKREMEFWPLIRVVKIYVKAPALSTGATIVDLPGVHDQNAARAAVAESYMKQCTGLWIVAPITRAVDDKVAKDLLGDSFKRQLKMDGGYSAVTFICSKTDDISVDEAIDSLGLQDELEDYNNQVASCRQETEDLTAQLSELKDSKAVYREAIDTVDDQLETWQALGDKLEEGKTVYAPGSRPRKNEKKRKWCSTTKQTSKKQKTDRDSDEDTNSDFIDDRPENESDDSSILDEGPDGDAEANEEPAKPLTVEEIASKLKELKDTKKQARRERAKLDEQVVDVRSKLKLSKAQFDEIHGKMSALCIAGRNQYSKSAIQKDFAAGIKELDQEHADEEDEENFDPDVDQRDYDEIAKSLPVFCVSSRGYQKLQGRMKNDQSITAFSNVDETEIPALQAHCRKLTEAGRSANCMRFLNSLNQLLNSLSLWVSNDGTGASLSSDQKAQEAKLINRGLEKLDEKLGKLVSKCMYNLKEEIGDHVYDKYEPAISKAVEFAPPTCMKWGLPVNRENRTEGGLYYMTYKAICRRNGIHTNTQGLHDFNMQLAEPMIKVLATGWEKVFARGVPQILSSFACEAGKSLKKFHKEIEFRAQANGTGIAGLSMLSQQLQIYDALFKDIVEVAIEMINSQQREINREFTPVIAAAMEDVYVTCTNERGPGSFARMKAHMSTHIHGHKAYMFKKSTDEVSKRLAAMLSKVKDAIAKKTDNVFLLVKRDYISVLGGGDPLSQGELMPKHERLLRKDVKEVIGKYDNIWLDTARCQNGNEIDTNDAETEGPLAGEGVEGGKVESMDHSEG